MISLIHPHKSTVAASLRKIKEKKGSSTRKLIGHSGPVYSVDFDPLSGSAAPPKYLLSASADGTSRLWSMDTMTNIVAFRGHENPVWDVKWSPLGTYFATASRDRTARLWSTDRTDCLRIYAGHLGDVDVRAFLESASSYLIRFLVCSVSPQLFVSSYWVERLDSSSLGCPERIMCASVPRPSRSCFYPSHQP